LILRLVSTGGVRGPGSGEPLSLVGLFCVGLGDGDFDLFDWDSDSEETLEACVPPLSSSSSLCTVFTSLTGLLLLVELDLSLPEDREPDRERDFDREPERERDRDLEDVGETERDREREAERDVERDSDPECEREERDESEEEDEDLLRELREETEWRLGDVVLCQGSIHSSLGRRELEIPSAFGLDLSFSSTTVSLKSSLLSPSFAVVVSVFTFTS